MKLKRVMAASLVISSLALTTSGVALGVAYLGSDGETTVVYECTCPTEEVTEPATEPPTETLEEPTIESTEEIEPPATTEPTVMTEPTEVADNIYLGEFRLTAYCPCSECNGPWSGGITSTGVIAQVGRTIAVDPTVIPYGTEVVINGHTYVAEDCGSSIKGNRIDIYHSTHEEANDFGVQYADVYIVRSE